MKKKILSFILAAMTLATCANASYASDNLKRKGPDLVVTDIRINNPYFKAGDSVQFEIDVKNIGDEVCPSGWIWFEAKSGAKNTAGTKTASKWSKKYLYPNETMTWSVVDFTAENSEMLLSVLCDSAYTINETNESNNVMSKEIVSLPEKANLEITDITVSPAEFKQGDTIELKMSLKNSGRLHIAYSEIDGEISVNKSVLPFKTVQELAAGEEVSFSAGSITADSEQLSISAEINPEHIIDESLYTDNEYKTEIHSVKEIGYEWDSVRVGGGGYVPHMAIHPADSDAIYIGTDVGGSYRYNHLTEEWELVTNGLSQQNRGYDANQAIALDPKDPDVVYMALGNKSGGEGVIVKNGILRSFDRGNTWTDINVTGTITADNTKPLQSLMSVDPNNGNVLYAVCPYEGLYRTRNVRDKVPVWEKLNIPGFTAASDLKNIMSGVAIDGSETESGMSKTIYVSTRTGGVYRSDDCGTSFTLLEESPKTVTMMQTNKSGELYVNADFQDGGILKYDGKNWSSVSPFKDRGYCSFAINPNDEKMIAAAAKTDLYVTDNGGLTWRAIKKISKAEFQAPWQPESYFANNLSFVHFDPINNKAVWFGDWFGVWRTDDITAEQPIWKSTIRGLEEFCVRNIKPSSGKIRLFIGAMDNCGVATEDIFNFPEKQFKNPYYQDTNCIDYAEKNPDIAARIGGDGWGSKAGNGGYSTDGGFTWQPFETYPSRLDNAEMKANNGYLAVASDVNEDGVATILSTPINHYVYRTTDYGKTWSKIDSLPKGLYANFNHYNDPIEADSVNKDIFYAYEANTGSFYLSKNNGESFEAISHLPKADEKNFIQALPGKEGCVFAALGEEGIWYSENYGADFKKLSTVEAANAFSIGKEAPESDIPTLYIYGKVNGMSGYYRSCNLGKTWEKIKASSDKIYVNPMTLKADRKDFGVFYTVNGGNGVRLAMPSDTDIKPPRVIINSKADGKTIKESVYEIKGTVTEKARVYADINGEAYETQTDENGGFCINARIKEGENKAVFYAIDNANLRSEEVSIEFKHDPNYIDVNIDQSSGVCMQKEFIMTGSVSSLNSEGAVEINGNKVSVNVKTKRFSYSAPVHEGLNSFEITAWDDNGNKASKTLEMDYDTIAPSAEFENSGITTDNVLYIMRGKVSESCSVTAGSYTYQVQQGDSYEFAIPLQLAPGKNEFKVVLTDPAGNSLETYASAVYEPKENVPQNSSDVFVYQTASAVPKIDGVLSDGEWYMNRVSNRVLSGNTRAYSVFGLKGDSKYLYFAARVWDDSVNFGTGSDYDLDTVELFFDPELNRASKYDSKDHQVRLGTLDGSVSGVKSKDGVSIASSITEDGYIVEAAIPWSAIDITYAKGTKFGFDVSINDNSQGSGASRDGAFGWQGTANNYYDTSAFGTAVIE